MPYTEENGPRLYYEQAGGNGTPLVFVHGWCCDHTFFQPQFDHFAASYGVTTLDLRGCGLSDRPDHGYDIPTLADDVARLCRHAEIDRPVVIGHSLGGMIAIELAARYPSLASGVVAVDPGPITPTPETRSRFEGFVAQLEGPDGEAVRRAYVRGIFRPTDNAERRDRIADTMCAVPLDVATAVIRGIVSWNGVGALSLCRVPTLVLLAATGHSNDPSRLLAVRPGLEIGVTVGAGHFNQLEVPEQVNPMIERFLTVMGAPSPA